MLNVLIALLVAVNAIFWLWTQNHLAIIGWKAPNTEQGAAMAEVPIAPERILPDREGDDEAMVTPGAIDTTAAPTEWACWHLGPYSPTQQAVLQSALPLNSEDTRWSTVETVLPQRWVVTSERTPNSKALNELIQQAKAQQLDHRTSDSDVLRGRLILGTFINRDLAVNYLSNLLNQGWGPLSVMRERPPLPALLVQVHVSSSEALQRSQQALSAIPVMGKAELQVLTCEEPAPEPPKAVEPAPEGPPDAKPSAATSDSSATRPSAVTATAPAAVTASTASKAETRSKP